MVKIRQPTVVAGILFTATLALVGATVVAASLPSSAGDRAMASSSAALPTPSATATTPKTVAAPSVSADPEPSTSTSAADKVTPPKASKSDSVTYTVKRGDNLSDIAAWFKQHGFKDLYEQNKKIIGSNPDLIRPGQRITVSQGGMTVDPAK